MLDLYYKIWVDAITSAKAKKSQPGNWKLYTIVPISLLQGINLFTFFYWMKKLVNHNLPLFLNVNILNYRLINYFISIVLTLFIPFVILNYLLIFSNDRYQGLLPKYKKQNGKLYKKYALLTLGIWLVPIIIENLYFKIL
jgi:hypothetical protein